MKHVNRYFFFLLALIIPSLGEALNVGVGTADITPPIGTPSAGYIDRRGEGMTGVHDPLLATALFIDNGEKQLILCSVDNLGFTFDMVHAIIEKVHAEPGLSECDIYIASSHTHSGGGSYLAIPSVGEKLAGVYSSAMEDFYVRQTVHAMVEAHKNTLPGLVGIGYGYADDLSSYRGEWPKDLTPLSDVTLIKVTTLDGSPLAAIFNYPLHPTVLKSKNRLFSSDFVGYAREHIRFLLGATISPLYINGAQGDITPQAVCDEEDDYSSCESIGKSLAETVQGIWDRTEARDYIHIETHKKLYSFQPQATPFGFILPIDTYTSEINIITLNHIHAFLTIPGELSCVYDRSLKEVGKRLDFANVSIFGLTNDAHGYIISPESWRHSTKESGFSYGGERYGERIESEAKALLTEYAPRYVK